MKKDITDYMICPNCGSEDSYLYDTDEVDFGYDNIGHYYFYCHCKNCGNDWKSTMNFKYEPI